MNDIPRHEKLRDYMPNVNDEYLLDWICLTLKRPRFYPHTKGQPGPQRPTFLF